MNPEIDFTDPLRARKWLKLLQEHPNFGFVLPTNINLEPSYMGFDFYTNSLGLRGPECLSSGLVIMGTSYAMGFAVDRGENWYEQSPIYNKYLNIGMPVGLKQLGARLTNIGRCNFNKLILMYHPNMLTFTSAFERASNLNQTLFEYFKWETKYILCLKLLIQKKIRRLGSTGKFTYYKVDNQNYRFDKKYCILNREDCQIVWEQVEEFMKNIFPLFKQVEVIRCKVKEEVAAECGIRPLGKLGRIHQANWNLFRGKCENYTNTKIHEVTNLELIDFLPFDTHWSVTGNQKFSVFLEQNNLV